MIVFTNSISSRLQYISDFIGNEIIGKPFELTSDISHFRQYEGPKINYSSSAISENEIRVGIHPLLTETGIRKQTIRCSETEGFRYFFETDGDIPFDVFSAVFYLLSRYEEYLPHDKDQFGRYSHKNALAFNEHFLHQPIVNTWISFLKKRIAAKFRIHEEILANESFRFRPTYDIDEAYAYRHKDFFLITGGFIRSLLKADWQNIRERWDVMTGEQQDPYDSFSELDALHAEYALEPLYFIHTGKNRKGFDKNISPAKPAFRKLVRRLADKYQIGVHPSWASGKNELILKEEIETLEQITGKKISASRQHYIRFELPVTYRNLIRAGITDEYSMGYGGVNGFRASVASPFYWYDLEKEETTGLKIHPFCFMDATSLYQLKQTPDQALDELNRLLNSVRSVNGEFICIFHNNLLGTGKQFRGWPEVYKQFIRQV